MSLLLHLNFVSGPTAHAPFHTGAAGGGVHGAAAELRGLGVMQRSVTAAPPAMPPSVGAAGGAVKPAPGRRGWLGLMRLSSAPTATPSPASSGAPSVAHSPFVSPRYAAVSPNPEGPCSSASTAVGSFGLTAVSLNFASA